MIELTQSTAFMLYLCVTLLTVFALWISHHLNGRSKKIYSPKQELKVCEYCQFAYLEDELRKVNRCPQCKSFNKNNSYG